MAAIEIVIHGGPDLSIVPGDVDAFGDTDSIIRLHVDESITLTMTQHTAEQLCDALCEAIGDIADPPIVKQSPAVAAVARALAR